MLHDIAGPVLSRPDEADVATPDVIAAIPVRNESQRIEACLHALAAQIGLRRGQFGILLFLNNCNDGTADVVASLLPGVPWPVRVIEAFDDNATAGWARRHAMDAAAAWIGDRSGFGVILTSDADSRVGSDWVARNLDHIAGGADAVAGRISLDPNEAALLPASLHARGRLEAAYEALMTEFGARCDPEPTNPWPCHWTKSGATLAVTRSAYQAVGGVPLLAHGEDRALVDALREAGFVVRQPMDIEVVTSGRLDGRAPGGAADTMRRRCELPDSPCDDRLEHLPRAAYRVAVRRWLRALFAGGRLSRTWLWAPVLAIPRDQAARIAALPTFARVNAAVEAASPRLAFRPVKPSQLPGEIRRAKLVLSALRLRDRPLLRARPAGSSRFGSDAEPPQTQPTLP